MGIHKYSVPVLVFSNQVEPSKIFKALLLPKMLIPTISQVGGTTFSVCASAGAGRLAALAQAAEAKNAIVTASLLCIATSASQQKNTKIAQ